MKAQSAVLAMLPFIGMTLGSLGGGWISDRLCIRYGQYAGRSLWGAGDKPQALSVLTQVGGDAAALARLWGLWVAASP